MVFLFFFPSLVHGVSLYQVPSSPPATCSGSPSCNTTDNPCVGNAHTCGQGVEDLGGLAGSTLTQVTFYVSGTTSVTVTVDFGVWNSAGTIEKTDFGQLTFSTATCVGTGAAGTAICSITKSGSAVIAANDIIAVTGVSGSVSNVFFYASNVGTSGINAYDSGVSASAISEFGALSGSLSVFQSSSTLSPWRPIFAIIPIILLITFIWSKKTSFSFGCEGLEETGGSLIQIVIAVAVTMAFEVAIVGFL